MRGRTLTLLAALVVLAAPLTSQKPTRPAPAPAPAIDIPLARKAVVTIQALDANGQLMASGSGRQARTWLPQACVLPPASARISSLPLKLTETPPHTGIMSRRVRIS